MFVLASEAIEKTTWYPLTLGWLVIIAALGMFFGSTYLMLATNVGSRLGFLIVGAVGSGFLVILSLLWVTTATPLNVFKGRQVEWKAVAIVENIKSSNVEEVKNIETEGVKLSSTEFANVKSAADTVLAPAAEGEEHSKPEAIVDDLPAVDVIVTDIYQIGGSEPNPLHFEFRHTPLFAAAKFCQLDREKAETAFRNTCDTSPEAKANSGVLILEKDLGSLRQPPLFLFFGSAVLFVLFLLALRWRDQDLKQENYNESEEQDSDGESNDKELVDA